MSAIDELFDVGLGVAFVWFVCANVNRAVLVFAGHGDDGAGHGCREQHGLASVGSVCEKFFYVWKKSEVEHFVGFVEHHESNVAEVEFLLLTQIDKSTRCAHNNLCAGFNLGDLTFIRLTAVDGSHCGAAVAGGQFEVFCHLNAEFTSWHHDQCLGARFGVWAETLD